MAESSNFIATSRSTPDSPAPGYTFSAFSAADVPYFRSPFAHAVQGHAIFISFLDATIVSVEDMDRVEKVEGTLRERLQTERVQDAVFGTLDSDAWRGLKLTKGIFVCGLNRSGRLEYANVGQSARLVGENGTVADLSGETGEATLATGVALVVGNAAFTREIHPGRLAAAFRETRGAEARDIRDAIAYEWAHPEPATRSRADSAVFVLKARADSALFVLKASSIGPNSGFANRFEAAHEIGMTVGSGTRSYGTTDVSFLLAPTLASSQAA